MINYRNLESEDSKQLISFLKKVDSLFPIPLSHKQDLKILGDKFLQKGLVIGAYSGDLLLGIAGGYANDTENKIAYLSVLCVCPEFQGKSIAKTLMENFIEETKKAGMKEMFLYTRSTNEKAIGLYKKLGFEEIISDREGDTKLHISFKG